MDFPDTGAYPEEQREAIEKAKHSGEGVFYLNGYTFSIEKNGESFSIKAFSDGYEIGSAYTSVVGKHYGLNVLPEHQICGIGKILYSTKVALDGILSFEWSGLYSRALFLIKRGYVPIAWTRYAFNPSTDDMQLSDGHLYEIKRNFRIHISDRDTPSPKIYLDGDVAILRFRYDPTQASLFLQDISAPI